MRISIFITLVLALSSSAQVNPAAPSRPPWQTALRGEAVALEAALELETLLAEGDLGGLARHLPESRLRLLLLDAGVKDGFYGPLHARALLAEWLFPLEDLEASVVLAVPNSDESRLTLVMQWLMPRFGNRDKRLQLVCELSYGPEGWTLEEAVAP